MKKKMVTICATIMLASVLGSGVASAAYNSKQDLNVNVNLLQDQLKTNSTLGQTTFNLQEGIQNTVASQTGAEVDHSYVWVNVNGSSLLAVDPPVALFDSF